MSQTEGAKAVQMQDRVFTSSLLMQGAFFLLRSLCVVTIDDARAGMMML